MNQSTLTPELINEHVNNLDDKGKLQLPEDMPDLHKQVIRSEKRQRDAQSELSKTQSDLRDSHAVNKVLSDKVLEIKPSDLGLSAEEATQLETLKYRNPEQYRLTMNKLEKAAHEKQSTSLSDLTTKAKTEAQSSHMETNRVAVFAEFAKSNPQITADVIANDVPPRFSKDLNEGKYDYATFLVKAKDYLITTKVVQVKEGGDNHNLSNQQGSRTPGKKAAEEQGKQDYSKMML